FPEGVETFEREMLDEDESRGDWYLRQMLGSANISGSKAMHIMTGNLSHQIEHHLFPDLPSNRYAEAAVKVKQVFEK
ncbi:fatty acid desaturase, partial [Escherichia coli]|uniref:fatty acid desaturase n=1 Tax=Escherichia coli TaxID=562 RepID=UPI001F4A5B12